MRTILVFCLLVQGALCQVPNAPSFSSSPRPKHSRLLRGSAPITYTSGGCSAVGAGSFPSSNSWSFTVTPQAAGDACVFMVECHPSAGTITSFGVSAPGWAITYLDFISDTTVGRAGQTFAAIAPNTTPTTFTVSAFGASNCSDFAMQLGGEVSGANPTGGITTFESSTSATGNGTNGCNDPSATITPISNNDFLWYGCVSQVSSVNAPYTQGSTDGGSPSDTAEYQNLSGGAGTPQPAEFTSTGAYIVGGIAIRPTATTQHSVKLTWSAPTSGCSSNCTYNLYRGPTSGSETKLVTGITTSTYTDTSVVSGNSYCYQVTAVNNSGESGKSNETCVQIPNATVPTAPGTLTIAVQ